MALCSRSNLLRRFGNSRLMWRRLDHHVVKPQASEKLFTKVPMAEMQLKRIVPLRGYLYLPGNQDEGIPQYLRGPKDDFPFALKCQQRDHFTVEDWGQVLRDVIEEYLPKYKAVLIRGLPAKDGVVFNQIMENTQYSTLAYKFGTDRRFAAAGNVYGASNEPPPCIIEMHNEASYSPYKLVRKIFFYCQSPAPFSFGGETPICMTEKFMTDIDQTFIDKLRRKELRYLRILADQSKDQEMCWQRLMLVNTREEAEESMRKLNIGWRWNPNGSLTSWHKKAAFINHPETGEEIWFNQCSSHHRSYYDHLSSYIPSVNFEDYPGGFHACYGDGEELEDIYLQQVRNLSWQETVGIQLLSGDVLVLDNLACQHGRLNYHGQRKVFLSLTTD